MTKIQSIIALVFAACCFTACVENESPSASSEQGPAAAEKPVVYVSVPPYIEIAQRIAGDTYEVRSLVSESDDPHGFSPTPKQIAALSKAAVLFTGAMPFEEGLAETLKSTNGNIKIHSLTEGIELLEGSCELCAHGEEEEVFVYVKGQDDAEIEHAHDDHDHEHEHSHAEEHDHKHDDHEHSHAEHDHDHDHEHHHHEHELDPHVWLSPRVLTAQAAQIAEVLAENAPEAADTIKSNHAEVAESLKQIDIELTEKLAFMKGQKFYVYHGAFAYFAQAYGLEQAAIEIGGRRPEPKRITELVTKAKEDGVKVIFVQPQFDQSSAKTLADAIGGTVLELDPLEQDVFANLHKIADTIGKTRKQN